METLFFAERLGCAGSETYEAVAIAKMVLGALTGKLHHVTTLAVYVRLEVVQEETCLEL